MIRDTLAAVAICLGMFGSSGIAVAQHCAPIVESYLSGISITRSKGAINYRLDYAKTGGRAQKSYQTYLLAYSVSDADRFATLTPQQAIRDGVASVLHTQLSKRNDDGTYTIRWSLEQESFVGRMIDDSRLDQNRVSDVGGWKSFDDGIRIAVFIPFLDDEQYSVIEGLPEDRHECHPGNDAALLLQTLPSTLTVHFGIVQAVRLDSGRHYVQLNGSRPVATPDEVSR